MIIYGALLIPVLVAVVLYKFFKHETLWWEFLVPFVASLLFVVVFKLLVERRQVASYEYWGSMVQRVEYYEAWDEWIEQTCTSTCCCDKDGNNCTTTSYDCSYRRYHPAEYRLYTTTGEVITIDAAEYERVKKLFGAEQFIDLHRSYYTQDGDKYVCQWPGDSTTALPATTRHTYENRVKAADQSVFHFQKLSKEDVATYALKAYPKIQGFYTMDAVIGDSSLDALRANAKLQYLNGALGSQKQVRVFVLVFKDQPREAGLYQEWHWSGGNKNEFIVAVGIDHQRRVQWCHPISWTTNELLKVRVRDYVQAQATLNLCELADYLYLEVQERFERRQFKEFSYLSVEPPRGAVIAAYLLTLIINLCLSAWIVKNDLK